MEGGGSNRGREEEWREVQRMEGRRTDGGGKRNRGREGLVAVRRPVSSGRSRRAAIVWARRRALVLCRRCLVVVSYCRVSLSHELGMRGWCGGRVAWCGR